VAITHKQFLENTVRGVELELKQAETWRESENPSVAEYKQHIRNVKRRLKKYTQELQKCRNETQQNEVTSV
jgi:IS5 family transposase